MTDNMQERLIDQARKALSEADADASDRSFNALIDDLEQLFGKNHKEIAAELQRIAKTIEDSGDQPGAFSFKQRTCEVLLRRTMSERRQGRPASPPPPPPPPPPALKQDPKTTAQKLQAIRNSLMGSCEFFCIPSKDIERDAEFYRSKLGAEQAFRHDGGQPVVALKLPGSPMLLLISADAIAVSQPIFAPADAVAAIDDLKKGSVQQSSTPVITGVGTIYGFVDPSGNAFAVVDKKKRA